VPNGEVFVETSLVVLAVLPTNPIEASSFTSYKPFTLSCISCILAWSGGMEDLAFAFRVAQPKKNEEAKAISAGYSSHERSRSHTTLLIVTRFILNLTYAWSKGFLGTFRADASKVDISNQPL
jgi:hypothetical protein